MERNEEGMMKQQLDLHHQRRLTPSQAVVQPENQTHQQQHQAPPQQPQKCPRCESLNTKFCYYNNYSLTQPRYFCKACRRYWTHGGTLRNVPVGGGCRKGKRTKINSSSTSSASSGESSRSQQPVPPQLPPPPPPHDLQVLDNLSTSLALRNTEIGGNLGIPQLSSYYSGGGFLSSLAAMQSMNQPQQSFNQIGSQFGGSSSNLALLQGFNLPSLGSQQVQIQHQNDQFYQMGNRDNNKSTIQSFYPSENQSLVHPNRPTGSWNHQSLINNNNNNTSRNPSDQSSNPSNFWIGTSGSGTSLNPNQWPPHHLP